MYNLPQDIYIAIYTLIYQLWKQSITSWLKNPENARYDEFCTSLPVYAFIISYNKYCETQHIYIRVNARARARVCMRVLRVRTYEYRIFKRAPS